MLELIRLKNQNQTFAKRNRLPVQPDKLRLSGATPGTASMYGPLTIVLNPLMFPSEKSG